MSVKLAKIKNKAKNAGKYIVKRKKSNIEIEKEEGTSKENKLHWIKVITAAVVATVGTLIFRLVGWWMLLWMVSFLLVFPLIPNYFIMQDLFNNDKKEWIKITLKTGIGGYFFTFMVVSTIFHTLIVWPNYSGLIPV
jgi:hypothetical protein